MVAYDETGSRMPGDPPKGKNVEVRAMGLPGDRPGEAAGLLARCFHNNPNFVDLFPDQRARSRALTRVFAAGLRDALGFGYVYVATRGVESSTGGELVGVVAWLPPGRSRSRLGGSFAPCREWPACWSLPRGRRFGFSGTRPA
jgi:hypothetical protein